MHGQVASISAFCIWCVFLTPPDVIDMSKGRCVRNIHVMESLRLLCYKYYIMIFLKYN